MSKQSERGTSPDLTTDDAACNAVPASSIKQERSDTPTPSSSDSSNSTKSDQNTGDAPTERTSTSDQQEGTNPFSCLVDAALSQKRKTEPEKQPMMPPSSRRSTHDLQTSTTTTTTSSSSIKQEDVPDLQGTEASTNMNTNTNTTASNVSPLVPNGPSTASAQPASVSVLTTTGGVNPRGTPLVTAPIRSAKAADRPNPNVLHEKPAAKRASPSTVTPSRTSMGKLLPMNARQASTTQNMMSTAPTPTVMANNGNLTLPPNLDPNVLRNLIIQLASKQSSNTSSISSSSSATSQQAAKTNAAAMPSGAPPASRPQTLPAFFAGGLNKSGTLPQGQPASNLLSALNPATVSALAAAMPNGINMAAAALSAKLQSLQNQQQQPPHQRTNESRVYSQTGNNMSFQESLSSPGTDKSSQSPLKASASNSQFCLPTNASSPMRKQASSPRQRNGTVTSASTTTMPQHALVRLPCRARGMPMDHNIKTAYFEFTPNLSHGENLVCSYPSCRDAGIKFRYCAFCNAPVAKRNFGNRHGHRDRVARAMATSSSANASNTKRAGVVNTAFPQQQAKQDGKMLQQSDQPAQDRRKASNKKKEAKVPSEVRFDPAAANEDDERMATQDGSLTGRTISVTHTTRDKSKMSKSASGKSKKSSGRHATKKRSSAKEHLQRQRSRRQEKAKQKDYEAYVKDDSKNDQPGGEEGNGDGAQQHQDRARKSQRKRSRGSRDNVVAHAENNPFLSALTVVSDSSGSNPKASQAGAALSGGKAGGGTPEDEQAGRERNRRWATLLKSRPKVMNGDAMSKWLMKVMAISDRAKPVKYPHAKTESSIESPESSPPPTKKKRRTRRARTEERVESQVDASELDAKLAAT